MQTAQLQVFGQQQCADLQMRKWKVTVNIFDNWDETMIWSCLQDVMSGCD